MKIYILVLNFVFASLAYGSELCQINNVNELLSRIQEVHPLILEAKLRAQASQKLTDVSKQRPNPNLNAEALFGSPNSQFAADTFFSLQHTIELGGKRSARIKSAEAQIEMTELQKREALEAVMIDSVVKLYRLKQIQEISKLYYEATNAFDRIRERLKKLPSRSPEQQIEMDTLELASSAYGFDIIQKESEKVYIEKHLAFFSECPSLTIDRFVPAEVSLPSDIYAFNDIHKSVKVLGAKQKLKISHARLTQESSKKIPNISVGPAVGYGKSMGSEAVLFGAALSMPLPLLNKNKGRLAFEGSNVKTAELSWRNIEREAAMDLDIWKEKYQRFYKALQTSKWRETMDEKHQRIESLFRRGVVSTALVIEAHRQLIDFSEAQLSFELGAIEALWNIYRLTGNLDKGKLQ